jgi:hypothetical protein
VVELSAAEALRTRMTSLLLTRTAAGQPGPRGVGASVRGVVEWFGAMQAQDAGSAMWSLGVRLPGFTAGDVQAALERGEALRTWSMRGTVHLVPARDAHWMLDLMGSRALAGAARRRAGLGLDQETADRAVEVLRAAIAAGGGRLTRAQCLAALTAAGIDPAGQRGYHLLWYASQRAVTCIGPHLGKEQTFVLLDDWAPDPRRPSREEALATIALRYFRSHGPTTRQDFAGWTGLPAGDAKLGIAAAGLERVSVEGREAYVAPEALEGYAAPEAVAAGVPGGAVLALPGFDEYLLGYKERALMLDEQHKQAIIPGGNGMFQWTIVRGGRVVGTWRRSVTKTRVTVDVVPLAPVDRAEVDKALAPYGEFLGLPLLVRWP